MRPWEEKPWEKLGIGRSTWYRRNGRILPRTHCKKAGHEFTPENTAYWGDGSRRCRKCEALRISEWYKKRKQSHAERVLVSDCV